MLEKIDQVNPIQEQNNTNSISVRFEDGACLRLGNCTPSMFAEAITRIKSFFDEALKKPEEEVQEIQNVEQNSKDDVKKSKSILRRSKSLKGSRNIETSKNVDIVTTSLKKRQEIPQLPKFQEPEHQQQFQEHQQQQQFHRPGQFYQDEVQVQQHQERIRIQGQPEHQQQHQSLYAKPKKNPFWKRLFGAKKYKTVHY